MTRPQPGDHAVGAHLQPLFETRLRRARKRRRAREQSARSAVFGAALLTFALYQTGVVGAASRTQASAPVLASTDRPAPQAAPPPAAQRAASDRMPDSLRTQERIAEWVRFAQPERDRGYADRLAGIIVSESRRAGVSPMVVAATAYVESEFDPGSKPCIGVMQIDPPTARSYSRGSGLDAADLRDNVRIGARELGRHSVRDGRQMSLRAMWGRYNGCGPAGEYVDRTLRVLYRMRRGEPDDWRAHVASRGPLWVE